MTKIGLMISSYKGYKFLEAVIGNGDIAWVASYKTCSTKFDSHSHIKHLCKSHNVLFVEYADIIYRDADIIFLVGWQYLLSDAKHNCVVLHDSLLPACRGFCPTVTAIMSGLELGVTALRPAEEIDSGEILAQRSAGYYDNSTIKDIYDRLAGAYASCYYDVLLGRKIETDATGADITYSIWRDKEDYFIDWNKPGEEICRFVQAVGWPYDGAKTRHDGIVIDVVSALGWQSAKIENDACGKVFKKSGRNVSVVCGDGFVNLITLTELPKTRCRLK